MHRGRANGHVTDSKCTEYRRVTCSTDQKLNPLEKRSSIRSLRHNGRPRLPADIHFLTRSFSVRVPFDRIIAGLRRRACGVVRDATVDWDNGDNNRMTRRLGDDSSPAFDLSTMRFITQRREGWRRCIVFELYLK